MQERNFALSFRWTCVLFKCFPAMTKSNMAETLTQFLWFLQNEGQWIKRGKNHHEQGWDPG